MKDPGITQVYIYDFTFYGKDGWFPDHHAFIQLIRPLFKKWAFQLELCPTNSRPHYQGRGSLFKKKRRCELIKIINETKLLGMEVSESSNNSKETEVFYTLKYDTRQDGPWTDVTYHVPAYIPRQYRGLLDRLMPFQQSIIDSRNVFNDREINLVYDPDGNKGKSTCARLGMLHFKGFCVPCISDHKEITQAVCNYLTARDWRDPEFIFVDIPRALGTDPKKMAPIMVACEQIKSGHACDVRNHYTEWWFDSPAMWIFVNTPIQPQYMSRDRWKFWGIDKDTKELFPITHESMSQMSQPPENSGVTGGLPAAFSGFRRAV